MFDPKWNAGAGWDPASGLGALVGSALLARLQAPVVGPAPPPVLPPPIVPPVPPTPPPVTPPAAGPTGQQVIDAVGAEFNRIIAIEGGGRNGKVKAQAIGLAKEAVLDEIRGLYGIQ